MWEWVLKGVRWLGVALRVFKAGKKAIDETNKDEKKDEDCDA